MDDQAELRLKVLELAREMLHNAYVETKARIHNEWSLKADVTWKTTQRMLPYPQLPNYFTETDVLHKVIPLWQFVRDGTICDVTEAAPELPVTQCVEIEPQINTPTEPEQLSNNHTPFMPPPQPAIPITAQPDSPVASYLPAPMPLMPESEPTPISRGLKVLPAWMTPKRS
jgi:hypothetical protein